MEISKVIKSSFKRASGNLIFIFIILPLYLELTGENGKPFVLFVNNNNNNTTIQWGAMTDTSASGKQSTQTHEPWVWMLTCSLPRFLFHYTPFASNKYQVLSCFIVFKWLYSDIPKTQKIDQGLSQWSQHYCSSTCCFYFKWALGLTQHRAWIIWYLQMETTECKLLPECTQRLSKYWFKQQTGENHGNARQNWNNQKKPNHPV